MDAPTDIHARRISFGLMTAPLVEPRRPDGRAPASDGSSDGEPLLHRFFDSAATGAIADEVHLGSGSAEPIDGLLVGIVPGRDDDRVGDDETRALGQLKRCS